MVRAKCAAEQLRGASGAKASIQRRRQSCHEETQKDTEAKNQSIMGAAGSIPATEEEAKAAGHDADIITV